MASTQLIRKKEATPSTVIQTIDDSQYYVFRLGALTTMVASQRVSNKEGSESLQRLAREVAGMAAVFDEANRAREEQRKIMDELHQDLLMRIQSTRDYMTQASNAARTPSTLTGSVADPPTLPPATFVVSSGTALRANAS
eukprot:gene180-195_t